MKKIFTKHFYSYKEYIDKTFDNKIFKYANDKLTMKDISDELVELDHMEMDMNANAPSFLIKKYNLELQRYITTKFHLLRSMVISKQQSITNIIATNENLPFSSFDFAYSMRENYVVFWRRSVMFVLEEMKHRKGVSATDIYEKFCNDPLKYCFSEEHANSIKDTKIKSEKSNYKDFIHQLEDGFKTYVNVNNSRIVELAKKIYDVELISIEIK